VSLRPFARSLVAASLAFALVAAAASGTAFSVNSVQGIAVTAAASGSVDTDPCTGSYDITWTVSSGNIIGVNAVRIPPSTVSDPGLMFCADMPYAILVADRADVQDADGEFDLSSEDWQLEWTGTTDSVTGSIDASSTAPTSGPLQLSVGTAVQLAIGPDPLDLPGAAQLVQVTCEELASGGTESQFSDGGDEYCLYVFDQVGTATFTALRQVDVEYLVVAGGGGGGNTLGGGGGAGGLLTNVDGTALTLAPGTVTVEVGAAGLGSESRIERGQNGGGSQLGSIVATGGGGGGSFANGANAAQRAGLVGGSGGGGSTGGVGGSGTAGQGNSGEGSGVASGGTFAPGGGGGGATSSASLTFNDGGTGGDGALLSITGAAVLYAAGGGGGSNGEGPGLGGSSDAANGGGGQGSTGCTFDGTVPAAGTGSGGAGGGLTKGEDCDGPGGAGASGVVIVRIRLP